MKRVSSRGRIVLPEAQAGWACWAPGTHTHVAPSSFLPASLHPLASAVFPLRSLTRPCLHDRVTTGSRVVRFTASVMRGILMFRVVSPKVSQGKHFRPRRGREGRWLQDLTLSGEAARERRARPAFEGWRVWNSQSVPSVSNAGIVRCLSRDFCGIYLTT